MYSQSASEKHETIIIPSSNKFNFGEYGLFEFREKNCILHDLTINFQVFNLSNYFSGQEAAGFPRLNTCFNWFQRIEICVGGSVLETLYPKEQLLLYNLFLSDEERTLLNYGSGTYNQKTERWARSTGNAGVSKNWYLPLWSLFKHCKIPLVFPHQDLQIKIYMDTLINNVSGVANDGTTNSYVTSFNQVNLIAKITRFADDYKLKQLSMKPLHFKYNEVKYASYNLQSPPGGSTQTVILSPIRGKVNWLMFYIQPNDGGIYSYGENQFIFEPVSFQILDATSKNIVGGRLIEHDFAMNVLNIQWVKSTYLRDTNVVSSLALRTTPNIYIYSFDEDPCNTVKTAKSSGSYTFTGSEQLSFTWSIALFSNAYKLDVFAFTEGLIESTPSYMKKLSM